MVFKALIKKRFNQRTNYKGRGRVLIVLMGFSLVFSTATDLSIVSAYSNLLENPDFENWSTVSGPHNTPTDWSYGYAGITAERTDNPVISGTYAAAVHSTDGDGTISQTIFAENLTSGDNSYTLGFWILDNVPGDIHYRFRGRDWETNTYFGYTGYVYSTNSPDWRFYQITLTGVTLPIEEINIQLYCTATGSAPIYMDRGYLSDTSSFITWELASINSPADITYVVNDPTPRTISWIATDDNPSTYEIRKNGVSIRSDTWINESSITVDVSGLTLGIYIYEMRVTDGDGLIKTDTVTVTVLPPQEKSTVWYYENLTPEDRRKIRQAMDFAIPRDQITEEIEDGFAIKTATVVGEHLTGIYDPTVQARDFDNDTSLDLLEEVFGYRYNATAEPYFAMTLTVPGSVPERLEWATLITQSFNSIGIDATLEVWDWSTLIPRILTDPLHPGWDYNHGGFDGLFVGWSGSKHYANIQDFYGMDFFVNLDNNGNNYIWLENDTLEDMLTTSLENPDLDQRLQAIKDIQHWLFNNVPSSMIRKKLNLDALDSNLEGFDPFFASTERIANWTISGQLSATVALQYFDELNPLLTSPYHPSPIIENTHMSLSRLRGGDNISHPVPYLADSWSHSPDGLRWNVKLRQGVQWSDGSIVTADDVIFSYQAMLDEDAGSYLYQSMLGDVLGNISAITKVNDYELNFTLPNFHPRVESELFALPIVQQAEMSLIPFSDWWVHDTNQNRIPIGSGPYQFKSKYWSGYETIVIERNPFYNETLMGHDPNMVGGGNFVPNPSLHNVTFISGMDLPTAVTELQVGNIDVIDKSLFDDQAYFDLINGSAWGKIVTSPERNHQELGYNQYSPIWGINPQDPRVLYRNLEVTLEVPASSKPLKPIAVDVTVVNKGFENYTDIVVQLLIDDSLIDSKTITIIDPDSTEALYYQWTPTAEGIYNISVNIVPIPDERLIDDNYASDLVTIQSYIPLEPIIITSDSQLNSAFPGTGTIDDPIRIEGYGITAANTSLVSISNTRLYFNITDCLLNGTQNTTHGIYLTNVTNGVIFSNVIFSSEIGIMLESSDNNKIFYNIIKDNSGYGLEINGSSDKNIVAFNAFYVNTGGGVQAKEDSSGIDGNTFIYNHWNDWTSPDSNLDGIVDNPYPLDGPSTNNDPYPLVSGDESTHLLVGMVILKPNAGTLLVGTVNIQWTPSIDTWEHEIDYSVYYSNDGGNNWNSILSDLSTTSLNWDTTTVDDGTSFMIKIVAVCSEGLEREITSSGTFSIDNVEDTTTVDTTTTEPVETTTPVITPGFNLSLIFLSLGVILVYEKRRKK